MGGIRIEMGPGMAEALGRWGVMIMICSRETSVFWVGTYLLGGLPKALYILYCLGLEMLKPTNAVDWHFGIAIVCNFINKCTYSIHIRHF